MIIERTPVFVCCTRNLYKKHTHRFILYRYFLRVLQESKILIQLSRTSRVLSIQMLCKFCWPSYGPRKSVAHGELISLGPNWSVTCLAIVSTI